MNFLRTTAAIFAFLALSLPRFSAAWIPDQDATLTDLLVSSDLVVRAKVGKVEQVPFQQVRLAVLEIEETIKGRAPEERLWVAEEKFFPSDVFALKQGREALLFLRPVPGDSRWAEYRSKGLRYILAKSGPTVTAMRATETRKAAEFLKTYVLRSAHVDESGQRALFEFLLVSLDSPVAAVQEAAASAFPEFGNTRFRIREEHWAAMERFILNSDRSLKARARMIEKISQTKLFETLAPAVMRNRPELRLAVLRTIGKDKKEAHIPQDALLSALSDPDPQVRQETLRVMSLSHEQDQDAVIAETSLNDPDQRTRAKALSVLAGRSTEANWDVFSRALDDKSPYVVYLAAGAIRDARDERSASELGRLLESDSPKSRFIGALMLGSLKDISARRILEDSSQHHADPATRELCHKILQAGVIDEQNLQEFLGVETPSSPGQ